MTQSPLVSVIITCYNIRDYIVEAITSVRQQTYANIEIVVIDDGSTDDTAELIRTCCPEVVYLAKVNGGPSSARNLGISSSRGEFVAFLDGDDLWESDKLEQQVAVLTEHADLGMVFADFTTFDENGTVVTAKNRSMFKHLVRLDYEFLADRNNFIYPSTVMVRRSVLEQVGGFDESLRGPEDWELWLRIARYTGVAGIHSSLTRIRQHATNISSNVVRMLDNEQRAIEKQRAYLAPNCFRKRMARLYLLNADRSVHNGQRMQALKLLSRGLMLYPFHLVSLCIVLGKILVGGKPAYALRRLVDQNRLLRRCFEMIYRRY